MDFLNLFPIDTPPLPISAVVLLPLVISFSLKDIDGVTLILAVATCANAPQGQKCGQLLGNVIKFADVYLLQLNIQKVRLCSF